MTRARISPDETNEVTFLAPVGEIDQDKSVVRLGGGVILNSSLGYSMRTSEIISTLDIERIFTTGEVEIQGGPLGQFTAGSAEILQTRENQQDRPLKLIFKVGVRLVYIPKTEG